MSKGKILITPRSLSKNGHPGLKDLEIAGYTVLSPFPGVMPTEKQLLDILPDCIGYLAGIEKISAELISKCPDLKVISRNGVGIDNVDKRAAEKMGISLQITPGANSRGVAELTIGLMFSLLRSIPLTNTSIKSGKWDRFKGMEIQGKTLGVVGTGMIGQEVISMAIGLGMKILAYDLYPDKALEKRENIKYRSMKKLLSVSDIVTLHCPGGNTPLIDKAAITQMKQGSYLINTARSALVDDDAVFSVLKSGNLSGYAVDTFEKEPPDLTPLLLHRKVITTAHIGGFTKASVDRATYAAVKNILNILEGNG
jgi:D-3-phosphoglycerate dehydrogenase / 2-oxoglutarate reductase